MTASPAIPDAARVRRVRGCAFQDIAGETVVVLPRERWVHLLNDVGAEVWNRLAAETTVAELAAHLCAEFDVAPEDARRDVEEFILVLEKKGLVEVTKPRSPGE